MKKAGTIAIFALVAALLAGVYFLTKGGYKIRTERRIYVDTIRYYLPVAHDSIITRYIIARLPEASPVPADHPESAEETPAQFPADSSAHPDSVAVTIPIESKHYKTGEYDAWISGYRPQIDSINVYNKTIETTIVKIAKKGRWGVGINAGIGITPKGATPYIGIGVNYNFFSL